MKLLQLDDGSVLAAMLRARWATAGYDVAQRSEHSSIFERAHAADVVVHLTTGWSADTAERDVLAVTDVLAALNGSGKRFVYVSDASVLGDTESSFGNEDDPTSSYAPHPWQVDIERTVIGAISDGVRAVIVRPALVHGPAGGSLVERLTAVARDHGRSVYVDDGHWRTSTVNATDLIELVVLTVEHAPQGSHYLAASTEVLTWREIAELIAVRTASERGAVSVSSAEASELGIDFARMRVNSVIRDDAAHRRLGWTPRAKSFAADEDS